MQKLLSTSPRTSENDLSINYEIGSLIDKVATAHSRSKQRSNSVTKPRKIRLAEPVEAAIDKQVEEDLFSYPFISYVIVIVLYKYIFAI